MEDQEESKDILSIVQERYEFYTGKASDINRSLALAGIAVIWIFKSSSEGITSIPNTLITPLIFLIISLGVDLIQYIIGGLIWWIYFLYKEQQKKKGKDIGKELDAPSAFPITLWILFIAKITSTIVAYTYLLRFLYDNLFHL